MKITLECSRLANKYFFITNLAEVDSFIRKNYNEAYSALIGELNEEQKEMLSRYRQWYRDLNAKNESERKLVMQDFYHEQAEEDILGKYPLHGKDLRPVFDSLELPFSTLWKTYEEKLQTIKRTLENNLPKRHDTLEKVWNALSAFYNVPPPEQIKISLIACPVSHYQGGKVVDASTVSLEISKETSDEPLGGVWLLFIHETIHAHFETKQYKEWLRDFAEGKMEGTSATASEITEAKNLLREATTSSLASGGYIAERYFNVDVAGRSEESLRDPAIYPLQPGEHWGNIRHWIRLRLRDTLEKYFDAKRKMDEEFLEKSWEAIEEYKKAAPVKKECIII